MPFYIEQTAGKNKELCDSILLDYRQKTISQREAFIKMVQLYIDTQGHHPQGRASHHHCPLTGKLENHTHTDLNEYYDCRFADGGEHSIDYFITIFYPFYALTFSSDNHGQREWDYIRTANRMNQEGKKAGDKFEVGWEY